MSATRVLSLVLVASACTGGPTEPATGSETAGEGSTAADGPGTTSTMGTTTSDEPTGTASTGATMTGGTAMDETTAGDTTPGSETGVMPPPEPKSCALAVIDPNADPAAVIDAGDAAGQLPTLVGEALLRNCGCHYTDDVPIGLYVDYSSNKQPLATHADFHTDFMGTFPMGFEDQPTYLAVEQRVVFHDPLPMPPFGCGVEGEPGMITAADQQLPTDWLAAGAPDGASFP
jgi:hypothetical protein